jgi:hypothetical protein
VTRIRRDPDTSPRIAAQCPAGGHLSHPGEASSGAVSDVRIGVAVLKPDCDQACLDPIVGFGWLDVAVPHPT